jgi:hypothetical protein
VSGWRGSEHISGAVTRPLRQESGGEGEDDGQAEGKVKHDGFSYQGGGRRMSEWVKWLSATVFAASLTTVATTWLLGSPWWHRWFHARRPAGRCGHCQRSSGMAGVARTAAEIDKQLDRLFPLTDDDPEPLAAYDALLWVVGRTDDSPARNFNV